MRNSTTPKLDTVKIGDDSEFFIKELIKDSFKDVKIIGNIGGKADIEITEFDDNKKYIQVKTLSNNGGADTYGFKNEIEYPGDMLIVMVNKERTFFSLEFFKNIKVKKLTLSHKNEKNKYKDIIYKDVNIFSNKLIELIHFSSTSNEITCQTVKKEILMLERFENFCNTNNIIYQRNSTNGNTIDGYINGKSFQAKFVSKTSRESICFCVNFYKKSGSLNGRRVHKSYEPCDFDFFIIELGGTKDDNDKYKNNFCIIPSDVLNEQKAFKTETNKGKLSIYISTIDYKKEHWTKKFWNNINNL